MSEIPVETTLPTTNDDSKERILFTLQISVKQIQHNSSLQKDDCTLSSDIYEVKQLCESLDKALFHGLRSFDKGYWSFVKDFTHKDTVKFLEKLDNVQTELQRGRAWLCLALNEASLESYFRSFMQNSVVIKKYYESPALFCDEQRMQVVLMLMAGLEYVPININVAKVNYGNGLSFFENQPLINTLIQNHQKNSPSEISKLLLQTESYELLPCDKAVEVTSDYKESPDTSPSENQNEIDDVTFMPTSNSDIENTILNKTVTSEDLEQISHFLNIASENDGKVDENLEVIHTKVVRRTKRSASENHSQSKTKNSTDSASQSLYESNASLENRLSKATTDSGLCLETPYSSDCELTDATDDVGTSDDGHQITFEVKEFSADISVTFSTPVKHKLPSKSMDESDVEERGSPEGQEDPIKNTCRSDSGACRLPLHIGNDGIENETDEEEEELSIYDLCKISSPSKNFNESFVEPKPIPIDLISNDTKSITSESSTKSLIVDLVSEELSKLALEKEEALDLRVSNNVQLYFLVEVYEHEEEMFYKLYCGFTSFSEAFSQRIYFLLSNKSVYILKPGNNNQKFFKISGMRYSNIDYIIVDLNYQAFKLISRSKDTISLYTASEELTREILSNLEMGIRRFIPKLPLPTVYTDATAQVITIKKFLASALNCEKVNVNLSHYVLARWEDYTASSITPSGPMYQDYLMYRHFFAKENRATQWQPGYFLLKGGVLYCMENEHSKPIFFIQMCAPHCKGCRRIHLRRPHTFEILHSDSVSLQLAAADNYEASRWLQSFLETVSLAGHFIDPEKSVQKKCCIMVANYNIVIAVEEFRKCTYKLLSKANICDLVSIFVDPVASNFVMLEFGIAEAYKSSGEWIITFESIVEKEKFLDLISQKWFEMFQTSISIENFKDIYLLKKYRLINEELYEERKRLQQFCMDD